MLMQSDNTFKNKVISQYKDLFSDELGELPVTYAMTLNPDVTNIVRPAHHILVAMQDS